MFSLNSEPRRGVVKMVLELGSIDMTMVQNHTRNTPLLVLAKVIEADGPEAIEVAGAADFALCMFAFNIPSMLMLMQPPCWTRA